MAAAPARTDIPSANDQRKCYLQVRTFVRNSLSKGQESRRVGTFRIEKVFACLFGPTKTASLDDIQIESRCAIVTILFSPFIDGSTSFRSLLLLCVCLCVGCPVLSWCTILPTFGKFSLLTNFSMQLFMDFRKGRCI